VAKVFCIGLSKTGTTTFGDACEMLGMSRCGWTKRLHQKRDADGREITSHELVGAWVTGDMERIVDAASAYDALEDLPWPLLYREMAEAFSNAKFVLTRRASTQRWLESIQRHQNGSRYRLREFVYGAANAAEDAESYVAKYEGHLNEVRSFFAFSDRFLEVCWEEGDGWDQLCLFLDLPVPDAPFPHSNKAGSKPPKPPRTMRRRIRRKYRRWKHRHRWTVTPTREV
jgi:hypothetical protein